MKPAGVGEVVVVKGIDRSDRAPTYTVTAKSNGTLCRTLHRDEPHLKADEPLVIIGIVRTKILDEDNSSESSVDTHYVLSPMGPRWIRRSVVAT